MQTYSKHRFISALALFIGVGALELLLLRMAGPPSSHLRALADLISPMAEPLQGILAALALGAQALAAYLVFASGLRALTYLPGLPGQVADHAEHALTIPTIRRGLDALVGGALIAHVALMPGSTGTGIGTVQAPPPAVAMAVTDIEHRSWSDPARPAVPPESKRIKESSSAAVSSPPVPLPIWLGGHRVLSEQPSPSRPPDGAARQGSTGARAAPVPPPAARMGTPASAGRSDDSSRSREGTAATHHTVAPGETLWSIALAHLPVDARAEATTAIYWRQIYSANRDAVGSAPNLIHPGMTLSIPPYAPAASPQLSSGTPHPPAAAPHHDPASRKTPLIDCPDQLP